MLRLIAAFCLSLLFAPDTPARFDRTVAPPARDALETAFAEIGDVYGAHIGRFAARPFEHPAALADGG